ncbi:MAG: DUF1974 domain-containing protein [Gammaproteobacteria bacterium]|nr:DUF1974 domain-containing protein [Gammaproteobacteria bacterium]
MFWLLFFLLALMALGYWRAGLRRSAWLLGGVVLFYGLLGQSWALFALLTLAWIAVFAPLLVPALRQEWFSRPAFDRFHREIAGLPAALMPLLEAGTAWWEAGLLAGHPDWLRLRALSPPEHGGGTVATVEANGDRPARPDAVQLWAQACTVAQHAGAGKVDAFRRQRVWAELLRRAGTPEQQVLAQTDSEQRAAIAGTWVSVHGERQAGACGRLARGRYRGEDGVGLELQLALGLTAECDARCFGVWVQLQGARVSGSACVLVPRDAADLTLTSLGDGRVRLRGARVFVPSSHVLGGLAGLGRGILELSCASARVAAVAAPAEAIGAAAVLTLGGACRMRSHAPDSPPLSSHPSLIVSLAALAGRLYGCEAVARLGAIAVAEGESPTALAAIGEYLGLDLLAQAHELAATLGSRGAIGELDRLCANPSRWPAQPLLAVDLGLRALGRCHPYLRRELDAARDDNPARGLEEFDAAFWTHLGALFGGGVRALVNTLGGTALLPVGGLSPSAARAVRRIQRASGTLALIADLALLSRRGLLSTDEVLVASLGRALGELYLAAATVWRAQHESADSVQLPLLRLAAGRALDRAQTQMASALTRLPRAARWAARSLSFGGGRWSLTPRPGDEAAAAAWLWDGGAGRHFAALLAEPAPAPLACLQGLLAATLTGEALGTRTDAGDDTIRRNWLSYLDQAAGAPP